MRTDPATTPELPTACPSCGAAVRSLVPWCSLCFAALLPDEPATAALEATTGAAPAPDPQAPAPAAADAERAELEDVARRLLGELAAQQGPRPGSRLPQGKAARVSLLAAGGVCGCALLVGMLALVGLFL